MNPDTLPPLRDIIKTYQLSAKKSFGQNFLLDLNLTRKIVRQAGKLSGLNVIEIGPGPGGLTRALLESDAERITAIEKDPRCIEALQDLTALSGGRLEIIEADALDINLADIVAAPRAILANLPYNIATPLLLQWLKQSEDFKHMTLMFQKEVAQRLIAAPGTKAYGRLSVIAGWRCNVRTLFDLPPSAFTPPPKVTSTVVQLTPRQIPENSPSFESMEQITAKAFGQRRKMLRKNFDHLEELGIPETARAEELSIQDFIALARRL